MNQFRISECRLWNSPHPTLSPEGRGWDEGVAMRSALCDMRYWEETMPKLTHFDKKGMAEEES